MSQTIAPRFKGVFPVVPTTFRDDGELDLDSQRRCLDLMIDAGSNGLCILANFSEQFVLSDEEREVLTDLTLEHVAGRVPVIVTTSHFSTRVCAERSRRAEPAGAGGGRSDGDDHAALPWSHNPSPGVGNLRLFPAHIRDDRYPDHDPRC